MGSEIENDLENPGFTKYCTTFPSPPEKEIFRESLIKQLHGMFSKNHKVIIIWGPQVTGKTVLLSQFARYYSDRTFSFFVGEDYWGHNVYRFLSDLCNQMLRLNRINMSGKLSNINIDELQIHDLKQLFTRLYSNLQSEAKKKNGPFFLVIDGIDRIPVGYGQENILDLIPSGDPNGVYVLLSSKTPSTYSKALPWPVQYFSKEESEKYFSDCLNPENAEKVYMACDGLPGYLSEIRQEVLRGTDQNIVLNNLPSNFTNLLEKHWNDVDLDENTYKLLALLIFSPQNLSIESIEKIISLPKDQIIERIKGLRFIDVNHESYLIINSAYKTFVGSKLEDFKYEINQLLIAHYEQNINSENSIIYLPALYKNDDKYESMVSLLNVNSLLYTFSVSKKVGILRRNLRILSEMSYMNGDWQRLTWSALAEAVFTRLITAPPAMEDNVDALLSLGRYEEALKMSYSCVLPEDRLRLFIMYPGGWTRN